jgi:hypothetical protein
MRELQVCTLAHILYNSMLSVIRVTLLSRSHIIIRVCRHCARSVHWYCTIHCATVSQSVHTHSTHWKWYGVGVECLFICYRYAGGRLRLAADFAQLELALEPLLGSKGAVQLNNDYGIIITIYNLWFMITGCLRALRHALFETPQQLSTNAALGDIIPYSLAIQMLISCAHDSDLQVGVSIIEHCYGVVESTYVGWVVDCTVYAMDTNTSDRNW